MRSRATAGSPAGPAVGDAGEHEDGEVGAALSRRLRTSEVDSGWGQVEFAVLGRSLSKALLAVYADFLGFPTGATLTASLRRLHPHLRRRETGHEPK